MEQFLILFGYKNTFLSSLNKTQLQELYEVSFRYVLARFISDLSSSEVNELVNMDFNLQKQDIKFSLLLANKVRQTGEYFINYETK